MRHRLYPRFAQNGEATFWLIISLSSPIEDKTLDTSIQFILSFVYEDNSLCHSHGIEIIKSVYLFALIRILVNDDLCCVGSKRNAGALSPCCNMNILFK